MYISPLRRFRIPLTISSWLAFAISLTFYWITADPGVSYWDCPEYVTVASKLEIGHPPGNPVWALVMRVATIPFSPQNHAYVINLCSGLFMAFATFFLCRIICLFTCFYFNHSNSTTQSPIPYTLYPILISLSSSLCFALCDSAWFSAVEAEVYAMSAFLTTVSLWIMVAWWCEKSNARQFRLLALLVYITGLSLGVHQLNLLLIPVFALIILYKKHPKKINPAKVSLWFFGSCFLLGFILLGFMPGLLFGAESFELFSVNHLGLPYHSGVFIFSFLLFIFFAIILYTLYLIPNPSSPKHYTLHLIPYTLLLFLIGFSSFAIILIRAQDSPFMNEGSPGNIFALTSYINRDQYPSSPLIYGHTPYSAPLFEEDFVNGKPRYSKYLLKKEKSVYQPIMKDAALNHRSGMLSHEDSLKNQYIVENNHGYVLTDYKFSQVLTPELNMWFPRMTSRDVSDRIAYADWGGMTQETMDKIPISETIDSNGEAKPRIDMWGERTPEYSYRPTYYQNLRYFVSYQAYYMYFRYLFWNFIGRQNDFHSNGEIEHGNFITGFPFLDNAIIGDTEYYPSEIWKDNKGHNVYFGIPFILGIIGIIWLAVNNRRSRRSLTLISVFFLMTGIAIVVYLNQSPGEPRERDYSFLGSYMAFSMWIAAGLTFLASLCLLIKSKKISLFLASIIAFAPATLMAFENFDDHDRRSRFEPTFYASSLLDFEIPSIIFSHGDNSTFPLWYASEVLDMGAQHIPVDITYLSQPDYVVNLKKQLVKKISTIASSPEIAFGKFVLTKIPADSVSQPLPLEEALKSLYKSNAQTPQWSSSLILIEMEKGDSVIINLHDFTKGSSYLSFKHLMLLDFLSQIPSTLYPIPYIQSPIPRTLFFPSLIDHSFYQPLDSLLKPALFGKIYAPEHSYSDAMEIMRKSLEREISKLENMNISPHYIDPIIADRSVRYRGELIIAAKELLNYGDSLLPVKIVDVIEKNFPYSSLLPGTFTISDSTYYEGGEFINLLTKLHESTGDSRFIVSARSLDTLMNHRRQEWLKFYNALTPSQRRTLSNRSKRLLKDNHLQQ